LVAGNGWRPFVDSLSSQARVAEATGIAWKLTALDCKQTESQNVTHAPATPRD